MLTKEKIIDVLKTIKYPGFSRDIVSFGLIKDIRIEDRDVNLILSLKSNNTDLIKELTQDIESLLQNKLNIKNLDINIELQELDSNFQNTKIEGIKKIIAVGSAKGGVGKSTIAINLASELSKKYSVGFLDLDIYGPSLPLMIGENKSPKIVNQKLIPIEKYGMRLMSFGFLNQGDSPAIWRGPMVAKLTNQFFDNVAWGDLDILVIDLPPGTGDIQLTLAQKLSLDGIVIITTPQQIALEDVRKGSEMFKKVNVPILGIIENMSKLSISGNFSSYNNEKINGNLMIDGKKIEFDKNGKFNFDYKVFDGPGGISESERLNVPLIGKISLDQKLSFSVDHGTPFVLEHTNNEITEEFQKIGKIIVKSLN